MKLMTRRAPRMANLMQTDLGRLFDRMFAGPWGDAEIAPMREWEPRIDIATTEKEVLVKADLPGVDPKDIEVTVVENVLCLKGTTKQETDKTEKEVHVTERFEGSFYREIPLPADADTANVVAKAENGVLAVTVPLLGMQARPQATRIPVAGG